MKFAAAYLLASLGLEQAAAEEGAALPAPAAAPTKEDVRRILGSVGAEAEDDRLDLLFALVGGKDVAELAAAGRERLAYAPSGATAAAVAAPGATAGAGAAGAVEEEEKEAKKEEEEGEEDEEPLFSLFDD